MSFLKRVLRQLSASSFVRKVATFQMGFFVSLAVGMVSSVVYPKLLGLEQYGLYAVVSAFAGLLSIAASFGQENTLTTFLSEAVGKKDPTAIRRVLSYYAQVTLLSTVIYITLMLLAPWIANLRGEGDIGMYTRWILLNAALQAPAVLLFITLQLAHRIKLITILENLRVILQLALSTFLIIQGQGMMGILVGTAIISAIYVPLSLVLYARYAPEAGLPGLVETIRSMTDRKTGTYFGQGLWMSLDRSVTSNLHPNILIMLINASAPLEVVGIARLALRLAQLPSTFLTGSISRVAAVTVPQLLAKDRKNFGPAAIRLILGSVGIHAMAIIGAAICVPPLVPYIYGPEFIAVVPAFLIMLPLNLFTSSHVISIPLLRITKKIYMNTINFVVGLGIAIGLFLGLRTIIDPVLAFGIAVLYVHAHGILIYLYVWQQVFKRLPTFKSLSNVIRTGIGIKPHAASPEEL